MQEFPGHQSSWNFEQMLDRCSIIEIDIEYFSRYL